jgi:electron transfer flavoprotein beta subunit
VKILVTAKRVEDPESKIKVKADGSGIVQEGLKYKINPFDEIAVEEAVRLKEKGTASEVVAVSIGPQGASETLRTALAMGADRAILVKHGGEVVVVSIGAKEVQEQLRHALAMGATKAVWVNHAGPLDPMSAAALLKGVIEREKPDLAILGKQSIDDDQNQTGQYLAEWLGWSQATFASKVESLESDAEKAKTPAVQVAADGKSAQVVREVDNGLTTLTVKLPAIVTTDLRLNLPRYASLPGIMKAKSKPIDELTAAALGVDATPQVEVVKLSAPPPRKAGVKVGDVQELFTKLKNEAKVI